jgi:hypothetical protein
MNTRKLARLADAAVLARRTHDCEGTNRTLSALLDARDALRHAIAVEVCNAHGYGTPGNSDLIMANYANYMTRADARLRAKCPARA